MSGNAVIEATIHNTVIKAKMQYPASPALRIPIDEWVSTTVMKMKVALLLETGHTVHDLQVASTDQQFEVLHANASDETSHTVTTCLAKAFVRSNIHRLQDHKLKLVAPTTFFCNGGPHCTSILNTTKKAAMINHLLSLHGDAPKTYVCRACGKDCKNRQAHNAHRGHCGADFAARAHALTADAVLEAEQLEYVSDGDADIGIDVVDNLLFEPDEAEDDDDGADNDDDDTFERDVADASTRVPLHRAIGRTVPIPQLIRCEEYEIIAANTATVYVPKKCPRACQESSAPDCDSIIRKGQTVKWCYDVPGVFMMFVTRFSCDRHGVAFTLFDQHIQANMPEDGIGSIDVAMYSNTMMTRRLHRLIMSHILIEMNPSHTAMLISHMWRRERNAIHELRARLRWHDYDERDQHQPNTFFGIPRPSNYDSQPHMWAEQCLAVYNKRWERHLSARKLRELFQLEFFPRCIKALAEDYELDVTTKLAGTVLAMDHSYNLARCGAYVDAQKVGCCASCYAVPLNRIALI